MSSTAILVSDFALCVFVVCFVQPRGARGMNQKDCVKGCEKRVTKRNERMKEVSDNECKRSRTTMQIRNKQSLKNLRQAQCQNVYESESNEMKIERE